MFLVLVVMEELMESWLSLLVAVAGEVGWVFLEALSSPWLLVAMAAAAVLVAMCWFLTLDQFQPGKLIHLQSWLNPLVVVVAVAAAV